MVGACSRHDKNDKIIYLSENPRLGYLELNRRVIVKQT
jgi:hypothetical protein